MSEAAAGLREEGLRLLQAGDIEGAKRNLEQAVATDPTDGKAHGLLGICHARKGDMSAAVVSMQESARLMPGDAPAQFNLANALYQQGRLPEARAAVERALAIAPDYAGAKQLLARMDASGAPAPSAPAPPATPNIYGTPPAAAAPPPTPNIYGTPPTAAAPPAPAPNLYGTPPAYGTTAPPPPTFGAPPPPAPGMGAPLGAPLGAPAPLGGSLGAPQQDQPWSQQGQWTPAPQPGMGAPGMGTSTAEGLSMPTFVASVQPTYEEPGVGTRLLRGLLWGAVFGQIWTILNMFWFAVYGGLGHGTVVIAVALVMYAFLSGALGVAAGLIMGGANLSDGAAGGVGIGAGILYLLIEGLIFRNPFQIVNIFFYFFTGRLIGSLIGAKVHQPVTR